jgi:ribonucleotide reductase alpha subunit
MVCGVSGGVEPLFAPAYTRRRKVLDENTATTSIVETLVVSAEYQKHGDLAVGAYDITPRAHFEMQALVQKHIDNAVSKTINLPEAFPVEELAELWLEFLPSMKGSTFYREGSREDTSHEDPADWVLEPMKAIRLDEIPELMLNWTGEFDMESPQDEQNAMECASGVCVI